MPRVSPKEGTLRFLEAMGEVLVEARSNRRERATTCALRGGLGRSEWSRLERGNDGRDFMVGGLLRLAAGLEMMPSELMRAIEGKLLSKGRDAARRAGSPAPTSELAKPRALDVRDNIDRRPEFVTGMRLGGPYTEKEALGARGTSYPVPAVEASHDVEQAYRDITRATQGPVLAVDRERGVFIERGGETPVDGGDRCESCGVVFTDVERPHITADDVWLCAGCFQAVPVQPAASVAPGPDEEF